MNALARHTRLVALLAALPIALSAGLAHAEDDDAPAAEGTYALRIRTAAPKKSPWGELLTNLIDRVKKDAAGIGKKLDVKVYWQTKSESAAVRSCVDGKSGGIAVSFGALAASVPELDATEIPYLFDNYGQADRALNDPATRALLTKVMRAKGFIYAIRGENGFRQWASVQGFLNTPDRFKGLAVRSQPSKVHTAMYSALGATPHPLQISDVPTSLESGKVVAYCNTLLFARLANWSDKIKFVTISNHIYQGAAVVWCEPWFKTLPKDLQDVLTKRDDVSEKLETTGLQLVRAFNDRLMPQQYKDAGKEIYTLTEVEKGVLKKALAPVEAVFLKDASPEGKELLALLKAKRGK